MAIVFNHVLSEWGIAAFNVKLTGIRLVVDTVIVQVLFRFIPVSTYCVFYYLLGYDLSRRDLELSIKWMLLLGGILGFTGMLLFRLQGFTVSVEGDNLFVAVYSVGFFSICIDNLFLGAASKNRIIQSISKCPFGIYFLHTLFQHILYKGLNLSSDMLPVVVGEVLFWVISFVGAYIMTLILRKIKFLKDIM